MIYNIVNLFQNFAVFCTEHSFLIAVITVCVLSIGAFVLRGPHPKPERRGSENSLSSYSDEELNNENVQVAGNFEKEYSQEHQRMLNPEAPEFIPRCYLRPQMGLLIEQGPLTGLQNLGLTCFINSLLQSLSSCAVFINWLEECHRQGPVASSLHYILKILSTERSQLPSDVQDPFAPIKLIQALHKHGWQIGLGEQDAHELFHLLMVTMEEEAHKAIYGGLADILETNHGCSTNTNNFDFQNSGDTGCQIDSTPYMFKLVTRYGESITRKAVPMYDCNRNYQASPFCGMLTSQLQCVKCGHKSAVRYDKFDSLSVHLPETTLNILCPFTLTALLDQFTQTEAVLGVACDVCNLNRPEDLPKVTSTSLKTLSIGKLPKCLCIHIHRMSIGVNGVYKRQDYVDFPEYLKMDTYTHNAVMSREKQASRNKSNELSATVLTAKHSGSWNHIYRLKAVIVHLGSIESGHFVTYRRGPLHSNTRHRSDRWYYTSDENVRDATLAEALQASAYMLFYEKCTTVKS